MRETLKGKAFSFFIDGWSDKKQSHLTIGFKYFDKENGLVTRLFDDLNYIEDGSGKALYCFVRKSHLDENSANCIQLVADGAMGTLLNRQSDVKLKKSTSFVGYMKEDFPHI